MVSRRNIRGKQKGHQMRSPHKQGSTAAVCRIWIIGILVCIIFPLHIVDCVDPKFDPSTRMRLVLVPADAQVGSVIYRLRGTDEEFDYPLTFELIGDAASATIKIESLPCTKYNSICQANVVLQGRLEPGRYYDFQVSVKDTKGGVASQMCSITATNFTTPNDLIFPHKPGIIMIPEDAKRGTELDYVIARKNPLFQKPVYLELWGSPLFAIRQKIVSTETTEGSVFLLGPIDFERQAMYHLTILANDAYAEPGQDSRNIAGLEVVVIVQDVQDQPPVFTSASPVTKLPQGILPGDKILKVHAEDGDKGSPREVRYGLVSEGNPFTSFFDINDTSGEIFLMRPLEDIAAITHVGDPVLLTVIAEEVKVGRNEPPAMASTVHYVSRVDENAPQGTALTFVDPYVPRVYDDDTGKNGIFALTLLNNNGTFDISPNVAERSTTFLIRVRDNILLDYEARHFVEFQILAQELGPATNLSIAVKVTVYINDLNDNPPLFEQATYSVELPENMTIGTKVVQVKATDVDSMDLGGHIRYTAILGYLNTSLNLDAETGLITVSTNKHGFDREIMPEYHLYVEARDNDGTGNRAQVPLVIKLIDVNDETPIFEKDLYEFILAPDLKSFTSTAIIHAIDKDATAPNNEVRYEIINGNYENKFILNKISGELKVREKITLRSKIRKRRQTLYHTYGDMFLITARAYDLGVPVCFSTTSIRIYPPESLTRTVTFVVPGENPEKTKTEETLSTITGGKVIIHGIRPLRPDEPGAKAITGGNTDSIERSVVTATVLYDSSSVVDISQIQHRLSLHNSSYAIMNDNGTEKTNTLYKAENKLLFWLLILLATLVALTILILLLCCICSWCPLYGAASERIVNVSKTEDDVGLVHREMANGKHAKSVQVAEWMGRREAWSAEKPADSRTKPTRWEFHNGREQFSESIGIHPAPTNDDTRRRTHSAEEQQKRVKIRNIRTTKDDTFHSSRTNLINDRDVFIEDADVEDPFEHNTEIQNSQKYQESQEKRNKKEIDEDSMRRHEIDRGSDIDYNTGRSSLRNKREFSIKDGNIEILQLMTRGKTRDGAAVMDDDNNIYMNLPVKSNHLPQPQLLMVDNSGKEILMRRFIEEQPDGKQIIREHYQIVPGATYIQSMPNEIEQHCNIKRDSFAIGKSCPNSVVYSQTEPEVKVIHTQPVQKAITIQTDGLLSQAQHSISNQSLAHELENSLKNQNLLLRQILMEKEKLQNQYTEPELLLETQSLPGHSVAIATQTECEVATQTEGNLKLLDETLRNMQGKHIRRKAKSENDDTMSEDECEYVCYSPPDSPEGVYLIKRRKHKTRSKYRNYIQPKKRVVMVEDIKRKIRTPIKEEDDEIFEYKRRSPPKKPLRKRSETRTSVLRRKRNEEMKTKENLRQREHGANRKILLEISDSLKNRSISPEQYHTITPDEMGHFEVGNNANDGEIGQFKVGNNANGGCDDGDEIENSNESDVDEIVIKSKAFSTKQSKLKLCMMDINDTKFGEFTSKNEHSTEKSIDGSFSRSSSEKDNLPEALPRMSRKETSQRHSPYNESNNRLNNEKHKSNSLNRAHIEANDTRHSIKGRVYQSQTELNDKGEVDVTGKGVPKYMEWYYSKQKRTISKTSSDPKAITGLNKKNKTSENRSTKTRLSAILDRTNTDLRTIPEPAPRISPPKSRLLKENIVMNKQHKPMIETDTSHPLLQHSEHRFERENAHEVPLPPSKLPHYMYPQTPPFVASKEQPCSNLKVTAKPSPIKENEVKAATPKISLNIENSNSVKSNLGINKTNTQKQLNASTLEDDLDSGIAMNSLLNSIGRRNPIADKKSVFSIAYDDVSRVKKITSDGESPQYS